MEFVAALLPSLGVGVVFWFAVRAMVNADRRERQAMERLDKELRMRGDRPEDAERTPPTG